MARSTRCVALKCAFSQLPCVLLPIGPNLALRSTRKAETLTQRIVEMLIGRLITDERFRSEFLANPEDTLQGLTDEGAALRRMDIDALIAVDPMLWVRAAESIDPRLQKISLRHQLRPDESRG